MRATFLPFAPPNLGEDEICEGVDTLRSGWITTGPKTERFALEFRYAQRFGWKPEDYPEAHFVSERTVSLPLFPGLSHEDQDDVVEAVHEVLTEFVR